MVVWLLSGGGEAEIRGLVPFFEKHFTNYAFIRLAPVIKKPGPRPGKITTGYGTTGEKFITEIEKRLNNALKYGENPDLIFVFDDLDCRDYKKSYNKLIAAINSAEQCKHIDKIVSFASPELESWIIASWNSSIAKHPDFRMRHERMRHWLSYNHHVPFDSPEKFSSYDKKRKTCMDKLSELIIESSMSQKKDQEYPRYSKAYHTPALLQQIDILETKSKCPIFNRMISELEFFSAGSIE